MSQLDQAMKDVKRNNALLCHQIRTDRMKSKYQHSNQSKPSASKYRVKQMHQRQYEDSVERSERKQK